MDIKDIFDRVLLKSGVIVLSKSKVEINIDAFRLLVEDSLEVYNRYSPYDTLLNREIYYPRQYDFSNGAATRLDPTGTNGVPEVVVGRVPDWIASANPMRYGGGSIGGILLREAQLNGQNELIDPILSPWRYNSPILSVSHSARYEIRAVYSHIISAPPVETGQEQKYVISTINAKDQALFNHIRSQFMIGLGRSRRSFTLNELPITMDANDLVSDGNALEEKALTEMSNYQKFYLTQG